MNAHFGHIVDFPSVANESFSVSSIEDGYKFIFYSEDGKEINSVSIDAASVQNIHQATGYDDKIGLAIEEFRKFGKNKWPTLFK